MRPTSRVSSRVLISPSQHVLHLVSPFIRSFIDAADFVKHRFEVYERSTKGEELKELAVRVSLSEGAHSAVLDSSLDAKHALQVQPRRKLTGSSIIARSFVTRGC